MTEPILYNRLYKSIDNPENDYYVNCISNDHIILSAIHNGIYSHEEVISKLEFDGIYKLQPLGKKVPLTLQDFLDRANSTKPMILKSIETYETNYMTIVQMNNNYVHLYNGRQNTIDRYQYESLMERMTFIDGTPLFRWVESYEN